MVDRDPSASGNPALASAELAARLPGLDLSLRFRLSLMMFIQYLITTFGPFWTCVLIYALLFIPTISLSNALSFHQITDAARQFPGIRVFGTIGWIAAGLMVGWKLNDASVQPMHMACLLSVVMGLGMWLGNMLFGTLKDHFTLNETVAWGRFWAYPAIGVILALVIFALSFREDRRRAQPTDT